MIDKIKVEPYKQHQGAGDQISYKGIPLAKVEQAMCEKINELVEEFNLANCCKEIVEDRKDADLEN